MVECIRLKCRGLELRKAQAFGLSTDLENMGLGSSDLKCRHPGTPCTCYSHRRPYSICMASRRPLPPNRRHRYLMRKFRARIISLQRPNRFVLRRWLPRRSVRRGQWKLLRPRPQSMLRGKAPIMRLPNRSLPRPRPRLWPHFRGHIRQTYPRALLQPPSKDAPLLRFDVLH